MKTRSKNTTKPCGRSGTTAMSKDPALLFYTSDFLTGTMFMTNEEVGIYIRLLCAQHQHGGIINKAAFNNTVKDHNIIREKFIETDNGFFNDRLNNEIEKRYRDTNASRNNGKLGGRPKEPKHNLQVIKTEPKHNLPEDEDEKNVFKKILHTSNKEILINMWNMFAKDNGLSCVLALTRERGEKLAARDKAGFAQKFEDILLAVKDQPFLLGSNDRKWRVTFDWLIANDQNYIKVLEKQYLSTTTGKGSKLPAPYVEEQS